MPLDADAGPRGIVFLLVGFCFAFVCHMRLFLMGGGDVSTLVAL